MPRRVIYSLLILSLFSASFTTELRADPKPSDAFVQQIIKLIGDNDSEFRAAGLEQVRSSAKGEAATLLFAAQLTKLDAGGQVALINALADRGDAAARMSLLDLFVSSKEATVRAAAIAALGKLGGDADVSLLIDALTAKSAIEQAAARRSLVELSGKEVVGALARTLRSAPPVLKLPLVEVLATRRAIEALLGFVDASIDDDAQVRTAAMNALGTLGTPAHVSQMMAGVLRAQPGMERDNAERNVALVCSRIEDEESRSRTLIDAINIVRAEDRDNLLPLVGRVGGSRLIGFVQGIATGPDAARRKIGIDALSKWPDASTADTLLDIATKTSDPAGRKLAFQGFVKVAAIRDNRNDKQRLERMKQAMKSAKTHDEQSLVIHHTRSAYDVGALRFVLPYVDQPQHAQIACETIVEIAHHREVRDPNKAEFDKALDKVIRTSKDQIVVERAQRYKRGETWDRTKRK